MIYITVCPKCQETISFLNNEDTKICKKCGESIYNTKKDIPNPQKINKRKKMSKK